MTKFLTPGVVAGALTFGAAVAMAAGKPALAAILNDPATASTATNILIGAGALLAGYLRGGKRAA
ncbi:hypothetical protein [Methylobacterium nodulans]|uniref:Uncharacterized protein n=1 Tax=Methylobacterium nodulans (strain LMG 21967 / CNCM I-2342 / ORS 2060) TaxID=460265 RepID=B8IDN0_METNO|nr:hypothetical protein [Methylobacterium nodulans]ACL55602.1 conserved hypothetical protein [Methylobacterium nodulans ORS 2060]